MKKGQIKELRTKSEADIYKMLVKEKDDLTKIMLDLKSKKLRNVTLPANKKKIIAVISTVIREKELAKI